MASLFSSDKPVTGLAIQEEVRQLRNLFREAISNVKAYADVQAQQLSSKVGASR